MALSTIQSREGRSGTQLSNNAYPASPQSPICTVQCKLSCKLRFEQELLEDGGPRELGVQQYATARVSLACRKGGGGWLYHLLEKVLQPDSPGLEKLGSELGYHALGW